MPTRSSNCSAVIVPTGAKGGFYPKALPDPSNRDAWLAEGTKCYRIFIRSLLSVTDNLVKAAADLARIALSSLIRLSASPPDVR